MSPSADMFSSIFSSEQKFLTPPSFVKAKVLDIADKENQGLVKVEYTEWEAKKNVIEWIPVLRLYAGKEYGLYVMPEIDDIVIVAFMGQDMRRPFIVGSLYPVDNTFVGENWVDKNTKRRLKFKGGVDFTVDEEDSKQSITAVTPKGLTITFQDETELITVSDKDAKNLVKIDSKNGQIDITADKKIVLTAGKCSIEMDGSGGAVTISGDKVEIKGTQSGAFDGGQKLDLKGGVLTAQGTQTAELKGSTTTTIGGGMINIG